MSGSSKPLRRLGYSGVTRVSLRHKVRGCIMYMAGLSFRGMTERTGLIPASHVAVYYWVQKLKGLIRICKPKVRRAVAVDET